MSRIFPPPLAFLDPETTGLSPSGDRIIEIGVITLDGDDVSEWTTLVNPSTRLPEREVFGNGIVREALNAAPRFRDIASSLYSRLSGRVLVAHNARFDFGFLKAEFQRAGIEFQPRVLCTVMLSRRLYPGYANHDLDALAERHNLMLDVRHRALPDARLIWRFWQVLQTEHANDHLVTAVEELLAGPVLPTHLDPSLIDRLPEAPGVFALHGLDDEVLHRGKAGNLKMHVLNYFRTDRISRKALAISHLVKDVKWRVAKGPIGAHLQLGVMVATNRRTGARYFSWKVIPEVSPCVELVCLSNWQNQDSNSYGLFSTERKARNALLRIASRNHLCHALLGIRETSTTPCTACAHGGLSHCASRKQRLRHLSRTVAALSSKRVAGWPYEGPIGVRERSDLHIIENWRYLGSAQTEDEVHQVLESRSSDFDPATFAFLLKTLARLPQGRVIRLPRRLLEQNESALA